MESENIPPHPDFGQEQQQQVESASSNSPFLASKHTHGIWNNGASRYSNDQFAWSPSSISLMNNASSRTYNPDALLCNTRRSYITGEKNEEVHIPWGNNNVINQRHQTLIPIINDQSSNKYKLDLHSPNMFPKFSDMISSTHSSVEDLQHLYPTSYMKADNYQDTNLLMNPTLLSPSRQPQFPAAQFLSNSLHKYSEYEGSTLFPSMPNRGTFSQIFPSVNISNLNNTHLNSIVSSPLNMNVQALDLFTSERFGDGISHDQIQNQGLGQQHLQLSAQRTTSSPNELPSNLNGGSITYTKRSQTEPPTSSKTSSKKSRSEPRACPPFKVRKEKLGDRITALQQLVAPFGKTDTASVLMEAIGYIKFLQNQVETLSVPYMKSSQTRSLNPKQTVGQMADVDAKSRRDLRSRGLCLVPLSCMSYVTNDDGGGWPSSDYHGGT